MNRCRRPVAAWNVAAVAVLAALVFSLGCKPRIPAQRPVDQDRVTEVRNVLLEGGAVGGGAAADEPEPTGWATLTGTFRFASGDIAVLPSPQPLDITGDDATYCTQSAVPKSESLVLDRNSGTVKDVLLFLSDDLSRKTKPDLWVHPSAAPGNTEPVIFDQKDCVFLTHVVAMQVSQPLEIHNSDARGHNTKLETFNQTIAPGAVLTFQHSSEKRMPYKASCSIHPWMSAWILARDNGYFAVTDTDGKFRIENLPAGVELTFKAWQEMLWQRANSLIRSVTVNGEQQQWSNRGFTLKLAAGEEVNLDIVLDVDPFVN